MALHYEIDMTFGNFESVAGFYYYKVCPSTGVSPYLP